MRICLDTEQGQGKEEEEKKKKKKRKKKGRKVVLLLDMFKRIRRIKQYLTWRCWPIGDRSGGGGGGGLVGDLISKFYTESSRRGRSETATAAAEAALGDILLGYLLPVSVAVITYWNSIAGDFVHDDIPAIVTNPDVVGTRTWYQAFRNDFWGSPMASSDSHKSYRPLTILLFR